MRPKTLVLQGFRSHRNPTEISFEDRTLLAICGPIGAGKSTILDAISYALFAKTPKIQSKTTSLICSGADEARVRLAFDSDGVEYEITRTMRRGKQGVHMLVDGRTGEKVTGESVVTKRVEEILGLDFDAFGSSVSLAQNRFSQFLEAAEQRRTQILKGVFRIDQIDAMRAEAKDKRGAFELQLAELSGRLGSIPDDIEDELVRLAEEIAETDARRAQLKDALSDERELLKKQAEAHLAVEKAQSAVEGIQEAARNVPDEPFLAELASSAERATRLLDEASKEVERTKKERAKAEKAYAALEKTHGSERELRDARKDAERHEQLEIHYVEQEKKLAEVSSTRDTAVGVLAKRRDELARTKAESQATETVMKELERTHSAHALRTDLKSGDVCPVCEQMIAKVPKSQVPALGTQRKKVHEAREVSERAQDALTAAANDESKAVAAHDHEARRLKELGAELVAIDDRLRHFAGSGGLLGEIDRRLEALEEATELLETNVAAFEEARSVLQSHHETREVLATKRMAAVSALIQVSVSTGAEPPSHDTDAATLVTTAAALRKSLGDMLDDASTRGEDARRSLDETDERLLKLRAAVGLTDDESIDASLAQAGEDLAVAKKEHSRLEAELKKKATLSSDIADLEQQKHLYDQLYKDLADQRFVSFLLNDRKRLLAELASERLARMTGDRYRFTDDGAFELIDAYNADAERSPSSLSGGETFLASLALALGLADAVARHGGRLQCFFIDEGFASLDTESFERAIDGIEELVSDDRLIVLISHLPALSTRVDDTIKLERDDAGVTKVVSGESL